MKAVLGMVMFVFAAACAAAAEPAGATLWQGAWGNRFGETQVEWTLELPEAAGEVAGTLRAGEKSWAVSGKREGAWLELSWTDEDGRITQARGVVGEGWWRGLTLSGGNGHRVEYGRFALRAKGR